MICDLTIRDLTIDCADAEKSRDFYADLMNWEKLTAYDCAALKTDNGLIIRFKELNVPYIPPVWPEEPGKQQKQMHLDFTVDDIKQASEKAMRLGATKPAAQYGGDDFVTLLDPEGRPFCFCKRSNEKSEFDLYYENKGYGNIPNISINIDCKRFEVLREFYENLTPWDRGFHYTALIDENMMVNHFMGCDGDFDYIPPVWPEEQSKQQKQMHFNYFVNDIKSAEEEVIRLGAKKTAKQTDPENKISFTDTEGHVFCLYAKNRE